MFDSSQWKPLQIYCVSRASWLEIYLMTPQPLGINHFLAARSLNSSAPNLVKCQVLRDRSSSGNQSTWTCPGKGIPSMFSYSLDEDGHGEMANRNMATGAWGFPKAAVMTVWSLSVPAQNNSLDTDGKEKVEMNWNMKANFPIMFTVCLAQIRSYSRAQKESCSYSSDHIGQSDNSPPSAPGQRYGIGHQGQHNSQALDMAYSYNIFMSNKIGQWSIMIADPFDDTPRKETHWQSWKHPVNLILIVLKSRLKLPWAQYPEIWYTDISI